MSVPLDLKLQQLLHTMQRRLAEFERKEALAAIADVVSLHVMDIMFADSIVFRVTGGGTASLEVNGELLFRVERLLDRSTMEQILELFNLARYVRWSPYHRAQCLRFRSGGFVLAEKRIQS
ncbi:MAG: hypothetical protein DRN26_01115 [Thermoplasmata archaeon]|nr:MAG: hypothetical protein DRN26_01115 [Thermoplasmata archaeon]